MKAVAGRRRVGRAAAGAEEDVGPSRAPRDARRLPTLEGGPEGWRDGVLRPLAPPRGREGRRADVPAAGDRPAARHRGGGAVGARDVGRPARRRDDPQGRRAGPRGRGRARRAPRPRGGRAGGGADRSASSCAARRRAPARTCRRARGWCVRNDAGAEVFSGDVALDGPRDMKAGLLTLRSAAGLAARPLPRGGLDSRGPLAPAGGDDRLLGQGRAAPRRGAEAHRLPRLAPGGRTGAPGGRHDLHGLRRPPQVPLRAEPRGVGPRLRRHEGPGRQHGPHRPVDGLVAGHARPRGGGRERALRARRLRPHRREARHPRVLQLLRLPPPVLRRLEPLPRPARPRGAARAPRR